MSEKEKPVNEWTVLDSKFVMAVVLLPVVVNFTIMVLLGVPDPIIKDPATAMYWVPKLSTDFEFVSRHYSATQARDFVIFFSNFCLISVIISLCLFTFRVTHFWKVPYSFRDRIKSYKQWAMVLFAVLGLAAVVFLFPSFFKEPGEISSRKFLPGFGAIYMSRLFISGWAMFSYGFLIALTSHLGGWSEGE